MIEVAKDARHEFGALHIVACEEAGDKQAGPHAGNAGMTAIIAPCGEQVQLRAWLHDAPIQGEETAFRYTVPAS